MSDKLMTENNHTIKENLEYTRDVYCMHPMVLDLLDYTANLEARAEQAEARLADYLEGVRRVLADEGSPDEAHCGCVPVLRNRIAELEAMVERLIEASKKVYENACCNEGFVYLDTMRNLMSIVAEWKEHDNE